MNRREILSRLDVIDVENGYPVWFSGWGNNEGSSYEVDAHLLERYETLLDELDICHRMYLTYDDFKRVRSKLIMHTDRIHKVYFVSKQLLAECSSLRLGMELYTTYSNEFDGMLVIHINLNN